MIQVSVNGLFKEEDDKNYLNFADFIAKHQIKGKVLAEIRINGQDIPLSALKELELSVFEGEEKIELTYKEFRPFTVELIGNIKNYLNQLNDLLPVFAERILNGDSEALRGINDLGEGLKSVVTMKEIIFSISGSQETDFRSLKGLEPAFSDLLNEINDSMGRKDWVRLSTILSHELPDQLKTFSEFFDEAIVLLRSNSM